MNEDLPLVPIEKFSLGDSSYKRGNEVWMAQTLIDFCKSQEYKEFDLPLAGISLAECNFDSWSTGNFIFQMQRVQNTDLNFPVILDDFGQIADGWHRVCKAVLEGKKTIKAIRMERMPAYDRWEEDKN